MKEEIRKVLEDLILEEQLEIILDVVETLLVLDYGLALDELSAVIMMGDDNADMTMLVSRINDILYTALEYILTTYEVKIADEATLYHRHAVVKTLISLPQYILPDEISKIIESGYNNEETLAHIVALFEPIWIDEILEVIMYISVGSFENIKRIVHDALAVRGVAETSVVPIERIRYINRIVAVLGRDKVSMMLELSNAGVRVGRSLEQLLELSFESLEKYNPVDATYQIMGLVWLSDTPADKVKTQIHNILNEYTENNMELGMMVKTFAEANRTIGEYK